MAQFAWHVHHHKLVEPLTEPIERRIAYIKKNKPTHEINLRLRLLRLVRGELPTQFVKTSHKYVAAHRASTTASQANDEARQSLNVAGQKHNDAEQIYGKEERPLTGVLRTLDEEWQVYTEAGSAYASAGRRLDRAWWAYNEALKEHNKEIRALHEQECPNCPWNGKTIFG